MALGGLRKPEQIDSYIDSASSEKESTMADTDVERSATNAQGAVDPNLDQKEVSDRDRARKRVERRHKFRGDLVAYGAINLFLLAYWAITDRGRFWPGFVLGGWGVFLVLEGWNAYFRRDISEAEVDQEMRRN
jgi:2TM domain